MTLGTTVQYTALGTTGSQTLPPLVVAGVPGTQTLTIPVTVAVAGIQALASAAYAANQIGNTGLATQFSNLSIALTSLVQNPTSAVYLSQSQAAIASIISQITPDPFLAPYCALAGHCQRGPGVRGHARRFCHGGRQFGQRAHHAFSGRHRRGGLRLYPEAGRPDRRAATGLADDVRNRAPEHGQPDHDLRLQRYRAAGGRHGQLQSAVDHLGLGCVGRGREQRNHAEPLGARRDDARTG